MGVWAFGREGNPIRGRDPDTPARKHAHTQKDYSSHSPSPPIKKQ